MDRPLADRNWRAESRVSQPSAPRDTWFTSEPSLSAQLQPFVGEDCPPDPAFFVESWTLGVSAAAENFRRRHEEAHGKPEPLASGSPHTHQPFWGSADWLRAASIPLPPAFCQTIADDEFPDDAADILTGPVTPEGARLILGVTASSTRDQIKAAYRQLAGRHHPDRHAAQSDRQRRLATERMAAINEAYRLLCALNADLAD